MSSAQSVRNLKIIFNDNISFVQHAHSVLIRSATLFGFNINKIRRIFSESCVWSISESGIGECLCEIATV